MAETLRRQGSDRFSAIKRLRSFFDTRTSHPLIDELDLRPQERLKPFLRIQPDNVKSITSLNSVLSGVGDNISVLIKKRGNEKDVGGKPAQALELPFGDSTILALYGVMPGFISIHRSLLEGGASRMDYNVYIPVGEGNQLTPVPAERERRSRYFARNERNGFSFDPENNSHSLGDIQGYLDLAQRATKDLLQASGLLEK